MQQYSKIVVSILVVALLVAGVFFFMNKPADVPVAMPHESQNVQPPVAPPLETQVAMPKTVPKDVPQVKEFSMTAFYTAEGKYFSLKEIAVKKNDRVRIKITNTKGMHDFTLDEYGLKKILPLNEEVVVEFTADKAGSFVYYCSMPGHRAGGQWGTLRVTE